MVESITDYIQHTPVHPMPRDTEMIEAVQGICINECDRLTDWYLEDVAQRWIPHITTLTEAVISRLWYLKHQGIWQYSVPHEDFIARRINECAAQRWKDAQGQAHTWEVYAGVPPLVSPGQGRYLTNPLSSRVPRIVRERLESLQALQGMKH